MALEASEQGNLIGSDARGHAFPGSGFIGQPIAISGTDVNLPPRIGGPLVGQGNLLLSYGFTAVLLSCQNGTMACEDGAVVQGNYINVDADGVLLPVQTIGGLNPGEANTIGITTSFGIVASGGAGAPYGTVAWVGNRFVGIPPSGRVPMRFSAGGGIGGTPLPNDPGDADDGPNRLQNSPEILSITITDPVGLNPRTVNIQYRVDSAVGNSDYPLRIDLQRVTGYANRLSSIAEILRTESYPAASAQQTVTLVCPVIGAGDVLPFVAMATDASGRSSEYTVVHGDVILNDEFEEVP